MKSKTQKKKKGESSSAQDENSPKKMGMAMMKQMLKQMETEKEDSQPSGLGQKKESSENNPMENMMGMCKNMLGTMHQTLDLAVYATPEVRALFDEWLSSLENAALKFLKKHGPTEPSKLAEALSISESLATSLMAQMKNRGKIRLQAEILTSP